MKRDIIEHLRRFSSVPGKEKTWVSGLNDDQILELYLKIRNGENARSIARHAQTVWGVARESSIHSISEGILKFKQRIRHLLLFPPSATGEANAPGFSPTCDEASTLEIMENIGRKFQARINTMIVEEMQSGARFPYIHRDLQALANLRKAILKEREWAESHEDPLKRKAFEKMTQRMDKRFNRLMEGITEDGQDRLIKAANRLLELAEQKAVAMYRREDGTYTLTDPEEKP